MRHLPLALSLALLSACTVRYEWPPVQPSPVPTAVPVPTVRPSPVPVDVRLLTAGRMVLRVDASRFQPAAPAPDGKQLDVYTLATLVQTAPAKHFLDVPALELNLRGTSAELCKASPCGRTALGITARYSASTRHDNAEPDESKHKGEGIRPHQRLPIGTSPLFDVIVTWRPGLLEVCSPVKCWQTARGTEAVAFGWATEGIPRLPDGRFGVGWNYLEIWQALVYGARAWIASWEDARAESRVSAVDAAVY